MVENNKNVIIMANSVIQLLNKIMYGMSFKSTFRTFDKYKMQMSLNNPLLNKIKGIFTFIAAIIF